MFLNFARQQEALRDLNIIWLQKKTKIRKSGAWKEVTVSVFPGYLFLDIENITYPVYAAVKSIPVFIKFLRRNDNIQPLSENDRKILVHFLSFGKVIGKSQVCFDKDMRIKVLSGPLKGLEGHIVKVDRRKQKAKILVDLYESGFYISLDFEVIKKAEDEADSTDNGIPNPVIE